MRVGIGYDSHRFDPNIPLVLGGVPIPNHAGLAGHSDGDAVAHAVIDALLGAAGLGDIGDRFPDTDPALRGASSISLLTRAVELLQGKGFRVVNVDVTVVAESPRLAGYRQEISATLAAPLGVDASSVSVKGKSNEGLGWIGRGEGLAVQAVALVACVAGPGSG